MDSTAKTKMKKNDDDDTIILELEESENRKEEEEEEEDDDEEDFEEMMNDFDDDSIGISYSSDTYKPTLDERIKLAKMNIQLRHTPPPQHMIEKTAGTRSLKEEDKNEFEKYIKLKTGTFSREEVKTIRKNWKAFCKLHKWDEKNPKPFLQMKYKSKEFLLLSLKKRIKFVQFLSDQLIDRSLYSVYQRFRLMYEPHKVSRYKPEEDSIILSYIQKYNDNLPNRKFADLASMLKRTRASVWRRYRVLQKKGIAISKNVAPS